MRLLTFLNAAAAPCSVASRIRSAVVLADCAQLVKANSIEGNKKATGKVRIVYTLWSNLHKTKGMADGSVDFKENKAVRIGAGGMEQRSAGPQWLDATGCKYAT